MPIETITGTPRSGKTHSAVKWAREQHKKGRKVFSNFPFYLDDKHALPFKLTKELFREGLPYGSVFVFDEGAMEYNSRNFSEFKQEDIQIFTMHGHMGLDGRIIATHPARIDKVIREVSEVIWWTRGFFFKMIVYQVGYLDVTEINQPDKVWRRNIYIRWPWQRGKWYDDEWQRHRFHPREVHEVWEDWNKVEKPGDALPPTPTTIGVSTSPLDAWSSILTDTSDSGPAGKD